MPASLLFNVSGSIIKSLVLSFFVLFISPLFFVFWKNKRRRVRRLLERPIEWISLLSLGCPLFSICTSRTCSTRVMLQMSGGLWEDRRTAAENQQRERKKKKKGEIKNRLTRFKFNPTVSDSRNRHEMKFTEQKPTKTTKKKSMGRAVYSGKKRKKSSRQ